MDGNSLVIIRRLLQTDLALIYSSWRNALWFAEKRDESKADEFYCQTSKKIRSILSNPHNRVKIACLDEDKDQIIGYSLIRNNHLLFVYVKADYRKKGIGTLLAKGFETVEKPETRIGKILVSKNNLVTKEKKNGKTEATPIREDNGIRPEPTQDQNP